ncbi:hypothetical protein [Bacillus kwashiorkori]|uniref:hypothetical protein n=1 Tax=Bacillus kwashiorkori TaxID=1522318 RepID=UPI0007822AF9|nr:hypothetical protein [Bacillus kwashiorkori]
MEGIIFGLFSLSILLLFGLSQSVINLKKIKNPVVKDTAKRKALFQLMMALTLIIAAVLLIMIVY